MKDEEVAEFLNITVDELVKMNLTPEMRGGYEKMKVICDSIYRGEVPEGVILCYDEEI